MSVPRLIGRVLLLAAAPLVVGMGVGLWTAHALIAHAVAAGTPEYNVRLAGAMGGLFAGGSAAALTGLALLLARPGRLKRAEPPDLKPPDLKPPDPKIGGRL